MLISNLYAAEQEESSKSSKLNDSTVQVIGLGVATVVAYAVISNLLDAPDSRGKSIRLGVASYIVYTVIPNILNASSKLSGG